MYCSSPALHAKSSGLTRSCPRHLFWLQRLDSPPSAQHRTTPHAELRIRSCPHEGMRVHAMEHERPPRRAFKAPAPGLERHGFDRKPRKNRRIGSKRRQSASIRCRPDLACRRRYCRASACGRGSGPDGLVAVAGRYRRRVPRCLGWGLLRVFGQIGQAIQKGAEVLVREERNQLHLKPLDPGGRHRGDASAGAQECHVNRQD